LRMSCRDSGLLPMSSVSFARVLSMEEIWCVGVALNLIRSFRITLGWPLWSFGELRFELFFDEIMFWKDFMLSFGVSTGVLENCLTMF